MGVMAHVDVRSKNAELGARVHYAKDVGASAGIQDDWHVGCRVHERRGQSTNGRKLRPRTWSSRYDDQGYIGGNSSSGGGGGDGSAELGSRWDLGWGCKT